MSKMIEIPQDIREAMLLQMEIYKITKEDLHRQTKIHRSTIRKALRGGKVRKDLQLLIAQKIIFLIKYRGTLTN